MVESIKELKKICVDKFRTYQKLRAISPYFTKIFIMLGFSANQVTLLAIILSVVAALFFFYGGIWNFFIGAIIVNISYFLDYCDGEVARYRKRKTITGLFLDQLAHQVAAVFIFFPIAFGIYLNTSWKPILIFGFLGSIFSISFVYSAIYWGLVRQREKELKKELEKYKKEEPGKKVFLQQGEITGKYNFIYRIIRKIKHIWTQPGYFIELFLVTLLEVINLHFNFFKPYKAVMIFVIVFGVLFTIMQISSLFFNVTSKSAEKNYEFLFLK